MAMSVNTNVQAMVALQNLNQTTRMLDETQTRINTGLKVNGAEDNAAIYAIAQNMRADVSALSAVMQSVNRATSIVDVSLAAGETISDLLVQMKEKVVAANDPSLDTASRAAFNEDFQALLEQIQTVTANAVFDGANLLDGSITSIAILADADALNTITLQAEDLSVSGSIITLASTANLSTITAASSALSALNTSLANVNAALARIGSTAKKLETHLVFVQKLEDAVTAGIGNLVDADLADESAKLQALQVKQQLGVQALSIANTRPQIILSLFGR
ncbi:MAG: flagellin [Alphaproteobacteria bacterium]|nr:flagellin [Alphaproteobacteria bacterium]